MLFRVSRNLVALTMSKSSKESVLTEKLAKNLRRNQIEGIKQEVPPVGKSQYFSPKKRNLTVEYETIKPGASVDSKTENVKNPEVKHLSRNKRKPKTKTTVETELSDIEIGESSNKIQKWEPNEWRVVLENLREMRKNTPAPVDSMGCTECSDSQSDEKTRRFHILVALMLSSQTKDQVTYEAMNRLKSNGLTPKNIDETEEAALSQMLYPVSFYKNKAKYLKKTARILVEQFECDIPITIEDLIKLPGVGPKMAHICMSSAWNTVTGIGVDVHVHRITNRLQWVQKPTKEPEETRKGLEAWLPKEIWTEINHLLVGFGQTICTPVKPKCGECLNKDICPSANSTTKKIQNRRK